VAECGDNPAIEGENLPFRGALKANRYKTKWGKFQRWPVNFFQRMFDQNSLLNLRDYPIREMVPFLVGCALWVVVYVIYIRDAIKYRLAEMPMFAGAGNLAWEFLWGFAFRPDMGLLIVYGYRAWFFLDVFIFFLLVRHGAWQLARPELRRHFVSLSVGSVLFWLVAYYFFIGEGYDTPIGANSAYIAQIFISVLYLLQVYCTHDIRKYSWPVVWLRSLGSGLTTVFMYMHYFDGRHWFMLALASTSLAADAACIWVFAGKRRALSLRQNL
jgi:hypothetical protein